MTLDGKLLYFTSVVTVRQLLEAILIWVTKTLKQRRWERNTGERREGYRDTKNINKSKKMGKG
jgi:hypothetical protein